MSSAIRNAASGSGSWFSTYSALLTNYATQAASWGKFGWSIGRHLGWFIVTTGLITVLPLVLELRREAVLEEFEKLQVNQGLAEGKTPQEMMQQGLTSAIEPKVL